MMTTPTYTDIEEALSCSRHFVTPAELHGILCGIVCSGSTEWEEGEHSLLSLEYKDNVDTVAINQTLQALFKQTLHKIQSFELDFDLLLPSDDEPLSVRASEFGKWSEGFIFGMNLSDPPVYQDPSEVDSILDSLKQTAEIEFEQLSFDEEDEAFFVEIVSFAKMAVFSIYQELSQTGRGDKKMSVTDRTDRTLH